MNLMNNKCIMCDKTINNKYIYCLNCSKTKKYHNFKNKLQKINMKDYFELFDDFLDDLEKTKNNKLIFNGQMLRDYLKMSCD